MDVRLEEQEMNKPKSTINDPQVTKNEVHRPNLNFKRLSGLLVPIPGKGDPADFFSLLFDQSLFELLVEAINDHAQVDNSGSDVTGHASTSQWRPTNSNEVLIFVCLIIHTGTIRLKQLRDYWAVSIYPNLASFSNFMSYDRFLMILKYFHFTRNCGEDIHLDIFHKVGPLISYFNNKMNEIYWPNKELSLDDPMVLRQGRLISFQQFVKSEVSFERNIKFYMLTESKGILIKCTLFYNGVFDDLGKTCHDQTIILNLMSDKLDMGHSIYLDHYYNTTNDLSQLLLQKKTNCTGTLRTDHELKVIFISTEFENNLKCAYYKTFMEGIKIKNQICSYYPRLPSTIRWYKTIGIHIIQMLLLNAFNLYNQTHVSSKMTLFDFRMSVLSERLPGNLKPKHTPKTYEIGKKGLVLRRKCVVCKENKRRRDTKFFCPDCPASPSLCLEPCFKIFHT